MLAMSLHHSMTAWGSELQPSSASFLPAVKASLQIGLEHYVTSLSSLEIFNCHSKTRLFSVSYLAHSASLLQTIKPFLLLTHLTSSSSSSSSSSSITIITITTINHHHHHHHQTWLMLTWSLGCTGVLEPSCPPSISMARLAITSLIFMLVCVPDPVCHITNGKWSSSFPPITCNRRTASLSVTEAWRHLDISQLYYRLHWLQASIIIIVIITIIIIIIILL